MNIYRQQNSLSAHQYRSASVCISDSISALHPIQDNLLAYECGSFFYYFYIRIYSLVNRLLRKIYFQIELDVFLK